MTCDLCIRGSYSCCIPVPVPAHVTVPVPMPMPMPMPMPWTTKVGMTYDNDL